MSDWTHNESSYSQFIGICVKSKTFCFNNKTTDIAQYFAFIAIVYLMFYFTLNSCCTNTSVKIYIEGFYCCGCQNISICIHLKFIMIWIWNIISALTSHCCCIVVQHAVCGSCVKGYSYQFHLCLFSRIENDIRGCTPENVVMWSPFILYEEVLCVYRSHTSLYCGSAFVTKKFSHNPLRGAILPFFNRKVYFLSNVFENTLTGPKCSLYLLTGWYL